MGGSSRCRIAIVVLAALAAGACQRAGESPQLAALDSAYRSGAITKSEYEAKKAALGNRSASLAALDKARDAGLLTPAEYQAHKEKLMAGDPAPAPASAFDPATVAAAPAAAAPGGGGNPTAAPVAMAPVSKGVRQEEISDPHLGMNAYDVTVPADWKFDGTYVAGSACGGQIPFPVFRMYSPDGLTEIRRLPRLDWSWSNTRSNAPPQNDCLVLKQDLSPLEFVKHMADLFQVTYVRDLPNSPQAQDAIQKNMDEYNAYWAANLKKIGMRGPTRHGGLAAGIAEFQNGTFAMEESIAAHIDCTRIPVQGPDPNAFTDSCWGGVVIMRAPKGKLDALLAMASAEQLGARENPAWVQKYIDFMNAMNAAANAAANPGGESQILRQGAAQRAQGLADFNRAQSVRAQQHQQFLTTMAAGTQASIARTQAAGDARHAVAQDWCDYALDQQTVTGAGGTAKVSNAYSNTWTDGQGHYYQTNYSNINPNGSLSGNWTQTTQVHGDGTAK